MDREYDVLQYTVYKYIPFSEFGHKFTGPNFSSKVGLWRKQLCPVKQKYGITNV